MTALISTRLRDMALRYDYEDRPLLIEAAEALERHLLARLEAELETARPEALCREPVAWRRVYEDGTYDVSQGKWRENDALDTKRWTVEPLYAPSPRGKQ